MFDLGLKRRNEMDIIRRREKVHARTIEYVVRLPGGTERRFFVRTSTSTCPDCSRGERFSGLHHSRHEADIMSRVSGLQCRTCDGHGRVLDGPDRENIESAVSSKIGGDKLAANIVSEIMGCEYE